MANFTHINQIAIAAIGAIVISTGCVAAAVGPATASGQSAGYAAATSSTSVQAAA